MTMYRDLQELDIQPFQDTIDTVFFFPGAGRREVLDEIKTALSQSVPLLLLTADEGSGKTMICRMVEKELPAGIVSVFLPQAINSFDDMVAIVKQEIGFDLKEDGQETDTAGLLGKIVVALEERNCRLVVFFDEAEKIYLATLERVRKLLDQVNEEKIIFQFVFSGRKLFEENLEQLSIVTFKDVEERRFTLGPLSEQEACHYLNHCMKIASGEDDPFFSQDLVSKVSKNGTNFNRLNRFAAESIQSEQLDTSFLNLIETIVIDPDSKVKEATGEQDVSASAKKKEVNLEFLTFRKILPGWILFGGGAAILVLLLFFLFDFTGDKEQPEDATSEVPIIELKKVVPLNQPSAQDIAESTERQDVGVSMEPAEKGGEQGGGPKPEELTDAGGAESPMEPGAGEKQGVGQKPEELADAGGAEPPPEPGAGEKQGGEPKPEELGEAGGDEALPEPAEVDDTHGGEEEPVELTGAPNGVAPVEPVTSGDQKPIQQKPEKDETENTSVSANTQQAVRPVIFDSSTEAEGKKDEELTTNVMVEPLEETETPFSPDAVKETKLPDRPILPETIVIIGDEKKFKDSKEDREKAVVEEVAAETRGADLTDKGVDALFLRRIAAGARWLVGGGGGKYTIQLMVLTSDQAEESLKKMLRTADYQTVANELYVLRRTGPDPTVMVFYGEYPSLAAARKGRNNLPVFLRKHNPYAISVFGAVEKATAPQ